MWDWNPVSTTARSAHYHGVNNGAKRPLSRCQRRREAPIITVSWASPSRLGLRPRGALRARGSLYELILYNLYKKCKNCSNLYYTICIKNVRIIWIRVYEFVQKLAKKRFASGLGFQPGIKMACNRRSATPSTTPPLPWVPILFIYRTIRRPSEKRDCTNSFVLHIVIPFMLPSYLAWPNKKKSTGYLTKIQPLQNKMTYYSSRIRGQTVPLHIYCTYLGGCYMAQ